MLEYIISLSVLIVLVLIIRTVFRKKVSPRLMYALWLVVVIRMVVPISLFEFEVSLPEFFKSESGVVTGDTLPDSEITQNHENYYPIDPPIGQIYPIDPPTAVDKPSEDYNPSTDYNPGAPITNITPPINMPDNKVPDDTVVDPIIDEPQQKKIDVKRICDIVWLSGALICGGWILTASVIFNTRLYRDRIPHRIVRGTRVFVSPSVGVPCVAGFVPAIYLTPESANSKSETLTIIHEKIHLRHGDHIWGIVRALAITVFWYNPLVWIAASKSKQDAELACDDAISSKIDSDIRLQYANILLESAPQKRRYALELSGAPIKERILMLTTKHKYKLISAVLALLLTVTAVGCAFVSIGDKEDETGLQTDEVDNLQELEYTFLMKDDSERISLYCHADEDYSDFAKNFRIEFAEHSAYVSTKMSAWIVETWQPQLYCMDIALPNMPADGIDDAVVILTTGTGTGVHIEEAHVLNGADGKLHSFAAPYEIIDNLVSNDESGKTWFFGKAGNRIDLPDNAYFDQNFKFTVNNGNLIATIRIGYDILQYISDYFVVNYSENGAAWEYICSDPNPHLSLDSSLTNLLCIKTSEIQKTYGKMTLAFSEYGTGQPVYRLDPWQGVYTVYYDTNINEAIADTRYADEVIVEKPYRGQICNLSIGEDIRDNGTGIVWSEAEYSVVNGSVHLVARVGEYLIEVVMAVTPEQAAVIPDESVASEDDWAKWEKEYINEPFGTIVRIRIRRYTDSKVYTDSQGPFVGYVASCETPWIDLYTEKNGAYVGRIPYEIFHDWVATDRNWEGWQPGWEPDYIHFYYAEFGDYRWAAAHLTDTVMGNGRKNTATSSDGGKTWSFGSTMDDYGGNHVTGIGFESAKVAVMCFDSMYEHDIFTEEGMVLPIVLSRTEDSGKTWTRTEILVPIDWDNYRTRPSVPVFEGDMGRVAVTRYDKTTGDEVDTVYLVTSDAGLTWEWEDERFNNPVRAQQVFKYDGVEYDLSKIYDGVNGVGEWRKIGNYIVAQGHINPNDSLYAVINTESRNIESYFVGSVLTHYGDDVNTVVYARGNTFMNYAGDVLGTCGDYITTLDYTDAQTLVVTGRSEDGHITTMVVDLAIYETDDKMTQYTVEIPLEDERDYITVAGIYGKNISYTRGPESKTLHAGEDGTVYYVMGVGNEWWSAGNFKSLRTYRVTSKDGYIESVEETPTFTKDLILKNGKPYTGELDGMFTCLAYRFVRGNYDYDFWGHTVYIRNGGTIYANAGMVGTGGPINYEGTYQYNVQTGDFTAKLTGRYASNGEVHLYPENEIKGKLYEYGGFVHFVCESSGFTTLTVNDPLPLTFVPNTDGYADPSMVILDDTFNGMWEFNYTDDDVNNNYRLSVNTKASQIRLYDLTNDGDYVGTYTVNPLNYDMTVKLKSRSPLDKNTEFTMKFTLGYSNGTDGTSLFLDVRECDAPSYQHLAGKMLAFKPVTEDIKKTSFVPSEYAKQISRLTGKNVLFWHEIFVNPVYLYFTPIDPSVKEFSVYSYTDYSTVSNRDGEGFGEMKFALPDDIPFDTAEPILAGGGGGSGECQFIVKLKKGTDVTYISYNNFHYTDTVLDFRYAGVVSDEDIEALAVIYPEIFLNVS